MFKVNISEHSEDMRTVESLVQELYDASCEAKHWAIVRHTSGYIKFNIIYWHRTGQPCRYSSTNGLKAFRSV